MQLKSSRQLQHPLYLCNHCLLVHLLSDVVAVCSVIAHKVLQQDGIIITVAVATHACIATQVCIT